MSKIDKINLNGENEPKDKSLNSDDFCYCFYDVETTSLNKEKEIIEISLVLTDKNFVVTEIFSRYRVPINPKEIVDGLFPVSHLSMKALKELTHVQQEDGKCFDDVWEILNRQNICLIGYNNFKFDNLVLEYMCKLLNRDWVAPQPIYKLINLPNKGRYSMDVLLLLNEQRSLVHQARKLSDVTIKECCNIIHEMILKFRNTDFQYSAETEEYFNYVESNFSHMGLYDTLITMYLFLSTFKG